MKKSLFILSLFLPWLLLAPKPSLAQSSEESCVDEICDGLDNDCDRAIDDNVDCGENLLCACGKCNKAALGGKCAEGVPWQGYCVVDHCPSGTQCNMKTGKCRRI